MDAPGIWALHQEISRFADTTVAAPASERSAAGHSISVYNEITLREHIREERSWAYGIDGTPADCVKMGLSVLMKDNPPDLVISGINRGQNTGTSIIYSGTVAAALEATMSGLPAIAVSLAILSLYQSETPSGEVLSAAADSQPSPYGGMYKQIKQLARAHEDYAFAARFTARLARIVARRGLPRGILLNVNIPFVPESEIRGVAISKMGHSVFVDEFKVTGETAGLVAYKNIGNRLILSHEGDDWDDLVLRDRKISITPLHYDLTHHHFIDELKKWWEEEEKEARELGAGIAFDLSRDLGAEIIG